MTDRPDDPHRDDQLLRLVAAAFEEADAVPEASTSRASAALRWRDDRADIALIVPGAAELIAVRDPDARVGSHRFESPRLTVDLAIGGDSLVGTIEPWTGLRATLEFDGGSTPVEVDGQGAFRVARPPGRVLRLRLDASDGGSVTTSWFLVNPARSN